MGFRFRKSLKVIPGVRLNLSKGGISASVGGRGATMNLSKRGVRTTASIPGTGLSWSSSGGSKGRAQGERQASELRGADQPAGVLLAWWLGGAVTLAIVVADSLVGWLGWTATFIIWGGLIYGFTRAAADFSEISPAAEGDGSAGALDGTYVHGDLPSDIDPGLAEDESGGRCTFVYVDENGEVTDRDVRNWRSDGRYLKGYCLTRKASRTFRIDRIYDWIPVE